MTLGVSINDLGNAGAGRPAVLGHDQRDAERDGDQRCAAARRAGARSRHATDTPVVFSTGNGNAISVSDVDAGSG